MNGGYHGLRAIFQHGKHPAHHAQIAFFTGGDFLEFLDIGTSDKSLAAADQDNSLDRFVVLKSSHGGRNTFWHPRTKRIDGWIVDRNDPNTIAGCYVHQCRSWLHGSRSHQAHNSNRPAAPCPPPMHIVTTP